MLTYSSSPRRGTAVPPIPTARSSPLLKSGSKRTGPRPRSPLGGESSLRPTGTTGCSPAVVSAVVRRQAASGLQLPAASDSDLASHGCQPRAAWRLSVALGLDRLPAGDSAIESLLSTIPAQRSVPFTIPPQRIGPISNPETYW